MLRFSDAYSLRFLAPFCRVTLSFSSCPFWLVHVCFGYYSLYASDDLTFWPLLLFALLHSVGMIIAAYSFLFLGDFGLQFCHLADAG